jgi:glycosyltransferase involved in cell wall biosynthesis
MRAADAIFVRCPGNLGLLGVMLAPLFARYRVAKYAGQWGGYPGEAVTYRWQRWLLRSRWWSAPVLVYGDWPGQPAHVVPFFTSLIDARLLQLAKTAAAEKSLHQPLRVLFVGRLSRSKNVHILIRALGDLRKSGLEAECRIIGEGPEQPALLELAAREGLENYVHFTGGLEHEQVMPHYVWADVLVLASETEGWPKAIAEAMTFGVVCIGSNRGFVPQMVTPERGLCIPPGNVDALVEALQAIGSDPQKYQTMSQSSAAWAQQYTMEAFEQAIRDLLQERWKIEIDPSKPSRPTIQKAA